MNIDLNRKYIKITIYTYSILEHKTVINLSTNVIKKGAPHVQRNKIQRLQGIRRRHIHRT